jgi:HYR domain/Right handed beta helix region
VSQAKMRSRTSVAVAMPLIILAIILGVRPGGGRAHSATAMPMTFTVTNLDDSGPGSLRDAIDQANMSPGADIIDFQDELSGTITLTTGVLLITDDLTINGPGIFSIIVSGNHASRIFRIPAGVTAMISGLTMRDGSAPTDNAGGIFSQGTLTLTNIVLSGNSALGSGVGLYSEGTFTIINSTISDNSGGGGGGGIWSQGNDTIIGSTISGNTGTSGGGGIFKSGGTTLTIINSTLSGNSAGGSGGGISLTFSSTVKISFTTLSGNSAASGGGIFNSGTLIIKNSIVANSASGGDCFSSGTFTASGTNFTTDGTCPGLTQVTPAQLNLGPLQDNGGPTQTHALLPGSVAIDAAKDCTDANGNPVTTDQRGIGRPQGKACDVGAYEFVPCNVQPTIICPEDFTASTDPGQCSAVVDYTPPAADCPCSNGGGAALLRKGAAKKTPASPNDASCSVNCSPPPGTTIPRGTTTVTCTVTDAFGNSAQCTFHITVIDSPPRLSCPAGITQSTDPDKCTAVVNYTVTASDDCEGSLTPSCSPPSGSTFQKGTTTVTCTATNSSKNTSSCSFPVTVNDTQPPQITCPANINTKTPQVGNSCVVVTYTTPTATDNCPLPPNSVSCTPPSGSCFPRGTTTVTCTATDSSGNMATCSFKVTVFDICLQDDGNPLIVVFVNSATGDYRFCCNGTVFTGKGKVTVRGSVYTLEHNPADRRVLVTDDESSHKGNASLQVPAGTTRCTISDRDTRNNTCLCQ